MKYKYFYKTSDGTRHEDAIEAVSREEAFSKLRKKGIRPIKVIAPDGAKANGEVRGVRKRVVAAIVAVAVALISIITLNFYWTVQDKNKIIQQSVNSQTIVVNPQATPRHQIYGDPVTMEELERGKFDRFLPRKGDHYLAWFAQPGKLMVPKDMSPHQLRNFTEEMVAELEAVVSKEVVIGSDDPREVKELKQIVNGMHEELRQYLANGNGTIRSYVRRLNERYLEESQIYERTKRELERETNPDVWDQKNEALRRLGLQTIPNPQEE